MASNADGRITPFLMPNEGPVYYPGRFSNSVSSIVSNPESPLIINVPEADQSPANTHDPRDLTWEETRHLAFVFGILFGSLLLALIVVWRILRLGVGGW